MKPIEQSAIGHTNTTVAAETSDEIETNTSVAARACNEIAIQHEKYAATMNYAK